MNAMTKFSFMAGLLASAAAFSQNSQPTTDNLLKQFQSPPDAAKPRVWWHWMNGNITKDGIRKDLFWMRRAGIGGFQNFDAAFLTPQIVEKRLVYMTPEWKEAFRYTAKLADSLHLEMAIAGSPGWSETGGPWVPAKNGMKKLVWTETYIRSASGSIKLPQPPATTGTFQNVALVPEAFLSNGPGKEPEHYYADIAVVAYKLTEHYLTVVDLNPKVSSSGGTFNLNQLTDGDLAATSMLPRDSAKGFAWIQFEFNQPQTIKAITIVGGGTKSPFGFAPDAGDRNLLASDDGENFRQIASVPLGTVAQQTITIAPTTAKYFRVTFKNPPAPANFGALIGGNAAPPQAPPGTDIAEIVLYPVTRINHFEEKAGFVAASDIRKNPTPSSTDVIDQNDVIDLTGKMNADGSLNWTPPTGRWKILRFGYSLTGKENHPASPEATGLEVDKLDAIAIKDYFETYLNKYKETVGDLMGSKGLQYMITDSYEAGQNNWTPMMAAEFQKRRGYNLLPWMPVLTGAIIKSPEASEKFLWDYRKTISELFAENHYDQLTTILAKYGMKRYTESHENGRVFVADGMDMKRKAAIPMSATWVPGGIGGGEIMHEADIRESASVAHIYGQNLVAAESMTALGLLGNAWSYSPEKLKPTADFELANGLNRFVIHTSVHQPVDDKIPGLGLGPFGQWFTRHETWAEQAAAWTGYLSRSSFLLQQGKFVADILYFYGEDNNITSLFGAKPPAIPEGYNFDYVNVDALINLVSVKNGKLVTPSGMSYSILVLDSNARTMSLAVLRKLKVLADAGAIITGAVPEQSPSLMDDPAEFNSLKKAIWSGSNPRTATEMKLEDYLLAYNVPADFAYKKPQLNSKIVFVHRKLTDREIYWLANRNNTDDNIQAKFRVIGKVPMLWHAETGMTEPVSYSIDNIFTTVSMHFNPYEAVFVVFKDRATKRAYAVPEKKEIELTTISGEWNINFQEDRGAPASVKLSELSSWTNSADAGVKYFSGTATYTKTIKADKNWFAPNAQIILDLGDVKNIAEVTVNGKSLGIAWKKPFRLDMTKALKPGSNNLVVKVTNLWVNRLIGDQQPGVTKKITFTTMTFYQAGASLLPSGLLGPVKILQVTNKK